MNGFLCVAAIAALLVAPNAAINCNNNPCSQEGTVHTLCKYPDPQPASDCGLVWSTGFSQDEKDEIINKHNELRQFVAAGREERGNPGPQPAASNMKIVYWDDELANIAQRWVNQCSFGHDQCRDVDRFAVGQNAATKISNGVLRTTPSDMIMSWYDEVKDMNRNLVKRLTNVHTVGHYTQLVWADSDRVGCGKIVYRINGWNRYYMVCNYGPAGNWLGEPIYDIKS